jgi:hypothetical protein
MAQRNHASIYLPSQKTQGRGNLKIRLNWNGQRYEPASGHSIISNAPLDYSRFQSKKSVPLEYANLLQ